MSTQDPAKLAARLSSISHILLVLSGKGGVGKSSISVQLALSLLASTPAPTNPDGSRRPRRIGLLDIDLTGPSIPRMLGLDGQSVHQSNDGWVPVYLPLASTSSTVQGENGSEVEVRDEMKVMSIGFLLQNDRQAVVWRGPKKSAMIRQFLADVRWGELDWLVIDTPPGTSDEHISLLENLLPALQPSTSSLPVPTLHSVLVTTPQAVSLSDVSKELSFTRRVSLPVLGLVENMSGYICPHCGDVTNIFGRGGGQEFCRLENEKTLSAAAGSEASAHSRLRFLGRVPIDSEFVKCVDGGFAKSVAGRQGGDGLVERYQKTKSSALLAEICRKVVALVEKGEEPEEIPPIDEAEEKRKQKENGH